jgi:hypothetical protein
VSAETETEGGERDKERETDRERQRGSQDRQISIALHHSTRRGQKGRISEHNRKNRTGRAEQEEQRTAEPGYSRAEVQKTAENLDGGQLAWP